MWSRLQSANRATVAILAVALAIVLFFAVNLIASLTLRSQRLDLTEDKLFTVTESTRRVLASVPEPITLSIYESSALIENSSGLRVYANRVNELLRTYAQLSNGKIRINRIDPVPFSTEEDRAISYGLQGFNLSRQGERGYFGLVGTNSVDQLETIQFLAPAREAFLEYDLTRVVSRLSKPTEPKLGVIDGLGMFGDAQQGRYPRAIIETLNENFELEQLAVNLTTIAPDIDALMIVHAYNLTDQAKYAIDQFVLSGKPLLLFVDTLAENSQPGFSNPNVPQFPASDLKPLTDAWGVEIVPEKVVGDRNMALRVTGVAGGRRVSAEYLPWLMIEPAALNKNDAITAQLQLMRMSSAGALRRLDGATTTITPLIQTTRDSMLFDEKLVESRPSPTDLLNQFTPSGEGFVLAARVNGPVKTAFPDGPPPPDPNAPEPPPQPRNAPPPAEPLTESKGPISVIIVTDTDMLANSHVASDSGQPISNNADFVSNALENLTGGNDLLGLRGRGVSNRPFERIDAIEREAEAKYRDTEQRLSKELEDTQQQLAQLQGQTEGGAQLGVLTAEQQQTVAEFNQRMLSLRQQLRDVRAALREEIDALDRQLRLINILLIPGIVVLLGIIVALWRRARLARYLRRRRAAPA